MKRIALLSLLLVPSALCAQQAAGQGHAASYYRGEEAAVGADVGQGLAQYDQRPIVSQPCETACPSPYAAACGSTGGWFGDIGFYVLRPQWSGGNPAFAAETYVAGTDTLLESEQADFEHDYSFAPLVQVGYAGRNGLGIRGRWWTLRSTDRLAGDIAGADAAGAGVDVGLFGPSLLGAGAGLTAFAGVDGAETYDVEGRFRNRVNLDVIDLEGIWETTVGRTSILLSSGVRYAHLGQEFDAEVDQFSTVAADEFAATFRGSNTFNGVGPTVSMQGYRMIGNTNLSLYGLSRGSVLFGERRQRAFVDVDGDQFATSMENLSVLPVMELEVGTNWTRRMGAFDFFAESGFVGQVWFNAGNAANSDTIIAGNIGTDNANQNMGLVGMRFSSGVRF